MIPVLSQHQRQRPALGDPYPNYGTLLLRLKRRTGLYSDAGTTPAGSGDSIGQWSGQNGTANAVQATGANQPAWDASGGVLFDGTSDILNVALASSYTGTTLTGFIVAKRVSLISNGGMLSVLEAGGTIDNGNTSKGLLEWEFTGSNLLAYREGLLSTATHPGNGVAYVYGTRFDGTNNKTWLNGTGQTQVASSGSWNVGKITVGKRPGTDPGVNAYIYEVLVYAAAPSDADMVTISGLLHDRNADLF